MSDNLSMPEKATNLANHSGLINAMQNLPTPQMGDAETSRSALDCHGLHAQEDSVWAGKRTGAPQRGQGAESGADAGEVQGLLKGGMK